jgi:hypothetical protein
VPGLELTVIHQQRLDAGTPRVLEPGRLGTVGDHNRNPRVEPAVVHGTDQRLQVAAAAGNQYAE